MAEKRGVYRKKCYVGDDANVYVLVSNWIHFEEMSVTKKSRFYDHCLNSGQEPECGRMFPYIFKHGNRFFSVQQFLQLTSPVIMKDKNGDIAGIISGYDWDAMALDPHPYHIEISENGDEFIRLWEHVGSLDGEHFNETMEYIADHNYKLCSLPCKRCRYNGMCKPEKCEWKEMIFS